MTLPPLENSGQITPGGAHLPTSQGLDPATLEEIREEGKNNLFFLAKGILGYKDMTNRTHKEFCEWMQNGEKRALGLMPRSHFKTTIELCEIIRCLLVDPEERILLVSESSENAEYMLREIKEHYENNELFRTVYSNHIPKSVNNRLWNKQSIILPRKGSYREPSIDTAGITSRIVSRHYTKIFCDDLISNEAMESPTVMDKCRKFVNRLVSLLVHPTESTIRIIGTRWAFHDIYSHVIENFPSYKVFIRKAIVRTADGTVEPFFPERCSLKMFQEIIENDPLQWATQYANDPLDTAVTDFKKEWLQYFTVAPDHNFRYAGDDGSMHIQYNYDLRYYIHVDPSLGEKITSDYTGIVVVGVNPLGRIFVCDAVGMRLDPLATAHKILELASAYSPKLITIESNAYQKSLMYYTEEEARRRGQYFRFEPFNAPSRKSKAARIRGALQPLFSTERVYVRRGLVDFIEEYMKFGKDDNEHMMDALAQGPGYWKLPQSKIARKRHKAFAAARFQSRGSTGYGI